MEEPISRLEMSRRAPLHFWAKADNARMAARYLWDATEAAMADAAKSIGYNSSTTTAAFEAFRRESSLALELIIKAVIARRIEQGMAMDHVTKVRATHDLPKLWKDAQLPELEQLDKLHLLQSGIALHWAGRYAAPLKDEIYERDMNAVEELLEIVPEMKGIKLRRTQPMVWDRFDKIYTIASDSFWRLREQWENGPVVA
ncbi:hypothetical protein [Rhizobium sp. CF142]|uniref:hypothetical protein n=1 Tax=Rhizobium sp. CF142 TaxID=1144314 RepID=UPI0012F6F308|nr:hypothetical protein [Rhizobium sp. CF142]